MELLKNIHINESLESDDVSGSATYGYRSLPESRGQSTAKSHQLICYKSEVML